MESNILFCHIPKCSGTSINDALKKKYKDNNNYIWYVHRILCYDIHLYTNYYKFAIIRDPIERLVSLYLYQTKIMNELILKKTILTFQQGNWFKIFNLYKKYGIKNIYTFLDNYKNFYYKEIYPYIDNIERVNKIKNMTYFYIVGYLPQYLFICDLNKKILVDDVILMKDENNFLKEKFNIDKIEHLNTHNHTNKDYKQFVSLKNTEDIFEIYKDDYNIFSDFHNFSK